MSIGFLIFYVVCVGKEEGGVKTPPYEVTGTSGKNQRSGHSHPRADMESAPTVRKCCCLAVVGADSISARPGRRGRRPLRIDCNGRWRADDEHRPLQMRYTLGRGEHCSPVNVEIRQTAAGEQCSPLHPLFLDRESRPGGSIRRTAEKR